MTNLPRAIGVAVRPCVGLVSVTDSGWLRAEPKRTARVSAQLSRFLLTDRVKFGYLRPLKTAFGALTGNSQGRRLDDSTTMSYESETSLKDPSNLVGADAWKPPAMRFYA
jgi:hypothetical protein